MDDLIEILKTCIPIIIGALIAVVPTITEKVITNKYAHQEKQHQEKQDLYVELISLLGCALKEDRTKEDLHLLSAKINLISITGSIEVVKALDDYLDTWKTGSSDLQNQKYRALLQVIRKDLNVDKKIIEKFPNIGLRDIHVKQ